MTAHSVRWAGDRTLILDFDDLEDAMSACAALSDSPVPGQIDVTAGARTALVRLRSHWHAVQAVHTLSTARFARITAMDSTEHTIDVVYDGHDLSDLAGYLDMSPESLVAWHSGQTWLAAFCGVAGFAYCVSQGESLLVPRLATPRRAVPGGSVILAAEFSGVYPRTGPSGWQIIGRTETQVWDPDGDRPALLLPWDTVRYRPVRPVSALGGRQADEPAEHRDTLPARASGESTEEAQTTARVEADRRPVLEIVDPGMQTLVQDLGREGAVSAGAGISGTLDRPATVAVNHLLGNPPTAPVLESLFGGLRIRGLGTTVLAVAGADCALSIEAADGSARVVAPLCPFVLLADETLTVGRTSGGARTVLGIRGGVDVPPVLGSASTDTHTGMGPPATTRGTLIRTGRTADSVSLSLQDGGGQVQDSCVTAARDVIDLRAVLGPRDDWFSTAEVQRFTRQTWRVTAASNRIGIHLEPEDGDADAGPLTRERTDELLSEGMALGSVQVPPSGKPVLLLNDQAITGGYPIIAVVIGRDLPRAGQLVPGDSIRFHAVDAKTLRPLRPQEGTSP